MSIAKFAFSKDWNNPTDFPTYEDNETQVRADLQTLHDETRDYINNTMLSAVDSAISKMEKTVTDELEETTENVNESLAETTAHVESLVEEGGYFDPEPILEVLAKY